MAKVSGPLFSVSASGKIANAMVHFTWKGIPVVREYLKPVNPKTTSQGDVRIRLGGLGRAAKVVQEGSLYQRDAVAAAPSGQSWISNMVRKCMKLFFPTVSDYENEVNDYQNHSARTVFDSKAAELGLTSLFLPYAAASDFQAGFQLYMLARYGIQIRSETVTLFNRAPYTVPLADWTSTQINQLVSDLVAP